MARNESTARRERNFFAKEIISRLDRIEGALPDRYPEPQGLRQFASAEAGLQSTVNVLHETVLALSSRLERMELLLFLPISGTSTKLTNS